MEIDNVKVNWAPILESQIIHLEEKLPGSSVRATFQKVIEDLDENRIKSRLILAGKKPAGYAYYIMAEGMSDRVLGNVGFVEPEYATKDRADNLLKWLISEGDSMGRVVMINDIFNGNTDTADALRDNGFEKLERMRMEILLRDYVHREVSVDGYSVTGIEGVNVDDYADAEAEAYSGTPDYIMFPSDREDEREFIRGLFSGSQGKVMPQVSRIARKGDKIVGAGLVVDSGEGSPATGYPLLIDMFVSRDHRRKGVARMLLSTVLLRSNAANMDRLYLWVNSSNPARKLYESLGFRESSFPHEIIYYRKK